MKLRHDEIRKKYGKSNGLPISVGRGWPGLPGHVQCRAVSAVCAVALQEHTPPLGPCWAPMVGGRRKGTTNANLGTTEAMCFLFCFLCAKIRIKKHRTKCGAMLVS
jgi:hypothetical protein